MSGRSLFVPPAHRYAHGEQLVQLLTAIADDGAYTSDWIAQQLGLDGSTAAKAIWNACKAGYVQHETSRSGRTVYVITPKGHGRIARCSYVPARPACGGVDIDAVHRRFDNVIDTGSAS